MSNKLAQCIIFGTEHPFTSYTLVILWNDSRFLCFVGHQWIVLFLHYGTPTRLYLQISYLHTNSIFFLSKHATWSVLHHIETTCGSSATLQAVAAPCRVSSLFTKSPRQCHPLLVHPLPMGLQRGRCPVAHHAPQYLYPHQQKVIWKICLPHHCNHFIFPTWMHL